MCLVTRIILEHGRSSNSVTLSSFEGLSFVMIPLFLLNRVFMAACLFAAGVSCRRFLIMLVSKDVPRCTDHLGMVEAEL